MDMVEECHGEDFEWHQTFSAPADVCFAGTARRRTFVHGFNTKFSQCLMDPASLLDAITETLPLNACTRPADYFLAPKIEVQNEAAQVAFRRKITFQPDRADLTYLLTEREWKSLQKCESEYASRYGRPASKDPNLVIFLGDDAVSFNITWSAVSGAIPTYRNNAKTCIFWSPFRKRFLTSREKLASMSWPVVAPIADGLGTPMLPTLDIVRAGDMAGRGMHLISVAIHQLVALACFGPKNM